MRLIVALLVVLVIRLASAASPDDIERLAQDAYIFGYPQMIMGLTEEVWLTHHGLNQFDHLRERQRLKLRLSKKPGQTVDVHPGRKAQ